MTARRTPVQIDRLGAHEWETLREVRLAALADSPGAFWSQLADEARFGREEWSSFLRAGAWFVARDDTGAVGLAAGLPSPDGPEPELIAMWVAPTARGRGIATLLTRAVVGWAIAARAPALSLWVADGNDTARTLYQHFGFVLTGEWAPMPRDAAAGEQRMRRLLSAKGEPQSRG
ncbi:MAG TPA: GNAT family N-acetyltransferase [Nakamurella sp.]|nr:GNAT family N-acetyltransferase [Nakamurella sp.]